MDTSRLDDQRPQEVAVERSPEAFKRDASDLLVYEQERQPECKQGATKYHRAPVYAERRPPSSGNDAANAQCVEDARQ